MRAISQEKLMISIYKISLKIKFWKSLFHLWGAKELTTCFKSMPKNSTNWDPLLFLFLNNSACNELINRPYKPMSYLWSVSCWRRLWVEDATASLYATQRCRQSVLAWNGVTPPGISPGTCPCQSRLNLQDKEYFYGLVQEKCNSIANAMELHLSGTNPLIFTYLFIYLKKIMQGIYCSQGMPWASLILGHQWFNSLSPDIFRKFSMYNFATYFCDWCFQWNHHQVNTTGLQWLQINIGLGNGLVLSDNKPLPEPVLT